MIDGAIKSGKHGKRTSLPQELVTIYLARRPRMKKETKRENKLEKLEYKDYVCRNIKRFEK